MTRTALFVAAALTLVVGAAGTLAVGCLAGSAPPGEQPGSINGVIEYPGLEAGPLRVAAFTSFPPKGLPAAQVTIPTPSFPQSYTLTGLPPGRYFILAIIDTVPDDGDRYHPRVDPGGTFGRYDSPSAITIDVGRPALDVDLELVAPTRGSPWDR